MAKETETTATVDPIAEAQAAVDAAVEAQAAAKVSAKELGAELKTAKANSKQADAYRKTLPADTDEATIAAADEAVTGWAAEVERLVAAVASAKETAGPDAVKAARAALKQVKGAATPKVDRVEQNGIKHPVGDGASATVWAIFDAAQSTLGRVPGIGDVIDAAVAAGVKESTTRAAYAHWRKFHGITGRVASEAQLAKQEEAAKAAAEKAAKAENAAAA